MMNGWRPVLLFVAMILPMEGALGEPARIGDATLEVPGPVGLVPMLSKFPEMRPLAETMVAPDNRLLELYVEPAFMEAMSQGIDHPLGRYAML